MEELRSKGTVHPEGFIEVTGPGAKEIAERIRLAPGAAEAGCVCAERGKPGGPIGCPVHPIGGTKHSAAEVPHPSEVAGRLSSWIEHAHSERSLHVSIPVDVAEYVHRILLGVASRQPNAGAVSPEPLREKHPADHPIPWADGQKIYVQGWNDGIDQVQKTMMLIAERRR